MMQSDTYGEEIDIVAEYHYDKQVTLQLGQGYFKSGDYMEEAAETNPSITKDNAFGLFMQTAYKF
ncbi:MAG: hypothetical protein ABXS92_03135 [Sulfurimonas sp.]